MGDKAASVSAGVGAGVDQRRGAGDRRPGVAGAEQRRAAGAHVVGESGVAEDPLDAVGELVGVARLEQQAGASAGDQLGEPAGARRDQRRAAGQGLQGDDPERLVERGDDDAAGAVDEVAQLDVGDEADESDDVADSLDVDLGLQLGQVAAPPGDDALDVGHS